MQVDAGRDPLTGKKRYKSKFVRGTGRASWMEARKAEGDLLKEVEGRKHKAPKSFTVAQLLDQWLEWRETDGKEISPSTLYNYRLTIATKIKPGLGHLAVAESTPASWIGSTPRCGRLGTPASPSSRRAAQGTLRALRSARAPPAGTGW